MSGEVSCHSLKYSSIKRFSKPQNTTSLVNKRFWFVVLAGVIEHKDKIGYHVLDTVILAAHCSLKDFLHVYWFLDDLVVIWIILMTYMYKYIHTYIPLHTYIHNVLNALNITKHFTMNTLKSKELQFSAMFKKSMKNIICWIC